MILGRPDGPEPADADRLLTDPPLPAPPDTGAGHFRAAPLHENFKVFSVR